jgi:hypothetical protein
LRERGGGLLLNACLLGRLSPEEAVEELGEPPGRVLNSTTYHTSDITYLIRKEGD